MDERFLSVIIPAYNEERRLPRTLAAVTDFLQRKSYSSEVIVVTDGSSDGTERVVDEWSPSVRLLSFKQNRGKGFAVRTGMLSASGRYRLFMDADYAVPIEFLDPLLEKTLEGADLAVGSRALKDSKIVAGQSPIRQGLTACFGVLQRSILDLPIVDTQCGFKLFTKQSAESLFSIAELDCAYFDAEVLFLAYHLGLKIDEIPVEWTHDQETRLPIGPARSLDLLKKLIGVRRKHGKFLTERKNRHVCGAKEVTTVK